jgi:cell division inhibitor SepF
LAGVTEEQMATAMRKMAVYLGLVEDDHRYDDEYQDEYSAEEYEEYGAEFADVGETAPAPAEYAEASLNGGSLNGGGLNGGSGLNGGASPSAGPGPSGGTDRRPTSAAQVTTDLARIITLHPRTYNEARTIGEHFRDGTPVIMNLTEMTDSDAKRLVDFSAGLIFGLFGSIERVTNKVFLLSPANVEVAAEDKARIAERGFFNQS